MSSRIKRNYNVLHVLNKASPKLRKAILENSNTDLVLALCEVISNVLSGAVKLRGPVKQKLKKHRSALRKVADKKVALKIKKQILAQKGGFLPALLAPALGLLATLIGNAL